MAILATIITTNLERNPKFDFFKAILEYEGQVYDVEENLDKVMKLTEGRSSPYGGSVLIWRDIQFDSPYTFIKYFEDNGLRRC